MIYACIYSYRGCRSDCPGSEHATQADPVEANSSEGLGLDSVWPPRGPNTTARGPLAPRRLIPRELRSGVCGGWGGGATPRCLTHHGLWNRLHRVGKLLLRHGENAHNTYIYGVRSRACHLAHTAAARARGRTV